MIKVLIADDEKKVCQLIRALVNWEDFDMEVVGMVHDGIEALDSIARLKPDLVITDIRMPGKDGLELISLGKSINPELEFVIISGYKHFEYAQNAIKLGVNDYLLKPINKGEIIRTLKRIQEAYKVKLNQMGVDEELKLRLRTNREKIRTAFFSDYLLRADDGEDGSKATIEYFNSKYHLDFKKGIFQTLIVSVDAQDVAFYKEGMAVIGAKIGEIVSGYLRNDCFELKTYIDYRRTITILNYADSQKERIRKRIRDILADILVQSNIFDNVEVTVSLGKPTIDVTRVKDSLRNAEEKAMQRIIQGRGRIVEVNPMEENQRVIDTLLSDFNKNLSSAVEILDEKAIYENFKIIQQQVRGKENVSGSQAFFIIKEAISIFMVQLRNYQFNNERVNEIHEKFKKELQNYFSYDQLFLNVDNLIKEIMDEVMTGKKQLDIRPIRLAKQYIQTNYMKHITLEEVSSVVGFSSAYFSSMFKKESGQNFVEYISEVRMNRAKDFLKTTNLSIAVICKDVGYSDIKHFTQSFKRYTGLKPNEFRKLYSWAGKD